MTEPGALLAAADAAATGGDLQTAERLLRDALALQEASLGPSHADVANTVNNLAVVCERLGKFDEAEQGYRRAHAIAVRSLGPKHPFVATSLKNLVDFCATRGIPLWTPPAPATDGPGVDRSMPAQAAAASHDGDETGGGAAFGRRTPQPIVLGLLAAAVIVVLIVVASRRPDADSPPDTTVPPPAASTPVTPAPPAPGRGGSPDAAAPRSPRGQAAADVPAPAATPRREAARPSPDAGRPSAPPRAAGSITVLAARVCTDFERAGSPDWRCTTVPESTAPGVFTFYTRVAVSSSTPIEHRWYRDGALHRTAEFSIPASGATGYRTFSRTTVSPSRAGAWRVELRTADGRVLHEQRFTVSR